MTLTRNPFYALDVRARTRRQDPRREPWRIALSGVAVLVAAGAVFVLPPWGRGNEGVFIGVAYGVTVFLYAVGLSVAGLSRGYQVLARERLGRRYEMLQCSPLSASDYARGLLAVALRPSLVEAVCWGAVLLLAGSLEPWSLAVAVAVIPYTSGMIVLTTLVGLWLAVGARSSDGPPRLLLTVLLYVIWMVGAAVIGSWTPQGELVASVNPLFLAGAIAAPATVLWAAALGAAAFLQCLLWAALFAVFVHLEWTPECEPSTPPSQPEPVESRARGSVKYAKPAWCRNPYLAVAVVRYGRAWGRWPHAGALVIAGLAGAAWRPDDIRLQLVAALVPLVVFGLCGLGSANVLMTREREPRRLDLLLTTGLPITALMYGQWLASLVPLVVPLATFTVFSLPGGPLAGIGAALGSGLGAGVGLLCAYRIRLPYWMTAVWVLVVAILVVVLVMSNLSLM